MQRSAVGAGTADADAAASPAWLERTPPHLEQHADPQSPSPSHVPWHNGGDTAAAAAHAGAGTPLPEAALPAAARAAFDHEGEPDAASCCSVEEDPDVNSDDSDGLDPPEDDDPEMLLSQDACCGAPEASGADDAAELHLEPPCSFPPCGQPLYRLIKKLGEVRACNEPGQVEAWLLSHPHVL